MKSIMSFIIVMCVFSVVGCGDANSKHESATVEETDKEKAKKIFGDPDSYNLKPGEKLGGI